MNFDARVAYSAVCRENGPAWFGFYNQICQQWLDFAVPTSETIGLLATVKQLDGSFRNFKSYLRQRIANGGSRPKNALQVYTFAAGHKGRNNAECNKQNATEMHDISVGTISGNGRYSNYCIDPYLPISNI